jgi:hypothetical protein
VYSSILGPPLTGSRSVGFCAVVSITPRMVVFRFVVRSGRPSA